MQPDVIKTLGKSGMQKKRALVFCVFFLALALRLNAVLNYEYKHTACLGDEEYYNRIALNLARKGEFSYTPGQSTSGTVPLYPLFLSAVYKINGNSPFAARLIQAVISAFTCLIFYCICRNVSGYAAAILSLIFCALYPGFILYCRYLLSETLFIFLSSVAILAILGCKREPGIKKSVLTGILMGLAALTKSFFVFFPLAAAGYLMFAPASPKESRREFKPKVLPRPMLFFVLIMAAAFLLPIAAWSLRNFKMHKEFIFTSNIGYTFWGANNQNSSGSFGDIRQLPAWQDISRRNLNETGRDNAYFQQGLKFIKNQSLPFLIGLGTKKIKRFFVPPADSLPRAAYVTIIFLSAWGIIISFKNFSSYIIFYLIGIYYLLTVSVFYGSDRLRLGLMGYIIIFVALAAVNIGQKAIRLFLRVKKRGANGLVKGR